VSPDVRVAVAGTGTGASAIQFVPEIQPIVGELVLFQRTAPWVLPHRNHVTDNSIAELVVGRTGSSLAGSWEGTGAQAHLGSTVPFEFVRRTRRLDPENYDFTARRQPR
jgi:cation diffusion facilitator CzcD-associated flavoprotein CzcO